jgi:hypothetical protein
MSIVLQQPARGTNGEFWATTEYNKPLPWFSDLASKARQP